MDKEALELFKQLPYEKKEAAFKFFSERMEKATDDGDGDAINRIEKALTRAITKSWHNRSTNAVNKALKTIPSNDKPFTEKDANKLLSSLEKSYNGVEQKTAKRVEDDIKEIYKINKKAFGKKFELDSKKKTVKFNEPFFDHKQQKVLETRLLKSVKWNKNLEQTLKAVEFGAIDAGAWNNLARLENVSIGDHFPNTLKGSVSNSIQKNVIEKGLNHVDASAFLEQDLTRRLGGNIVKALPESVAQGQMSTTAYFEGLNATNVTWARNFSQVNLMYEAGITQVVFNAIMDNLTSQICSQMDGRIFTIEHMMKHQENVLAAENVEAVKKVAPFTRNLDAFGLKAGQKLDDQKTSDALAKAGVSIPPLHFRCRSEIQPF